MFRSHSRTLGTMAIAGVLALAACDSSTDPVLPGAPAEIEVEPEALTLTAIGQSQALTVSAWDEDGGTIEDPEVTFSSNDETVATVDADGVVTAVGSGQATIMAEAGNASATATVTVVQEADAVLIEPDALWLDMIGATEALEASVVDAEGTVIAGASVAWSSSDEAVATVDEEGWVEATGEGTAVITAEYEGVSGAIEVTVEVEA